MATEIIMPQLGLTMEEGTVVKWFKNKGERIYKGEPLLEISTDKLTNQIESEMEGVLLEIVATEGKDVKVKGVLGYIGKDGESIENIIDMINHSDKKSEPAISKIGLSKDIIHVAIVGGGPGGYVAAIRAAQLGAKVTLIEKESIGGTCLNVGCIPTKSLLHSAEILAEARNAAEHGINIIINGVDWNKVQSKKDKVVSQLVNGVAGLLQLGKVNIIIGSARFKNSNTLVVTKTDSTTEEVSADRIIIATGSTPVMPPIPGVVDNSDCIDSTGALSLNEIPKSMVVIGGGVIGIEMASVYSQFGTRVIIIEAMPKLLPMMDAELTKYLRKDLESKGIEIITSAKVISVDKKAYNSVVTYKINEETYKIESEKILIAVGRKANVNGLDLEKAGIKTDSGKIQVNEKMETNVKGIYAIGDCLGKIMLAHIASAQGEIAAENALGEESFYDEKTNPSCVYTSLEFAGVGLTEEQAIEKNIDVIIGKFPMTSNGKALIMNNGDGIVKVVIGREFKEILGIHILGPRATEIIGEAALAIGMEATVEDIIATIHSHPTITEAVREAVLATENRAIHIPN